MNERFPMLTQARYSNPVEIQLCQFKPRGPLACFPSNHLQEELLAALLKGSERKLPLPRGVGL